MVDMKRSRERMVREQIEARGVRNPEVLDAMRAVPRHLFVQEALRSQAYEDHPLPLGSGQTISQPYIVALMSELVKVEQDHKVLEIGTGSGYQAAVLAEIGAEVHTIERIPEIYRQTQSLLTKLRYFSVKCYLGDGTRGLPEEAPYDRILVTAGGPEVPEPLFDQLKDPGRLVIPVGKSRRRQQLIVVDKVGGELKQSNEGSVAFVDLVGDYGWK